MTKQSKYSQDYAHKHGNGNVGKDKVALKEEFIEIKRRDAVRRDKNHFGSSTHEAKQPLPELWA